MAQLTIRKMRHEDLPQILAILAHWNMVPVPRSAEVLDSEIESLPDATIVAVADGAVVGVASYILHGPRRAETTSLAVDPAWRGSGVGERLQRARLAEMKALGVEDIFTETDRPEVIDWYVRKFGYRIAGTRRKKHAFSLPGIDHWTVLELSLRG